MAFKASLAQETMLADLREYHEASGVSLRDVEKRFGWANGKLSKTFGGKQSLSLADLNKLMEIYEIPKAERARLRTLRTQSRVKRTWWDEHRWIPTGFEKYIAVEDAAFHITCLQALLFPGLLQTESYMRELFGGLSLEGGVSSQDGIDVRVNRQKILRKPNLQLTVFLRETVLQEGSPAVLREQLDHVAETLEANNRVHLRIIPKRVLVPYGGVELFTLPGNVRTAASEAPFLGALVFEDSSQVRRTEELLASFEGKALSKEESVEVLQLARGKIK